MIDFQVFNPHTIRQNLSLNKKEETKWYDENEEKEIYRDFKRQNLGDLEEER